LVGSVKGPLAMRPGEGAVLSGAANGVQLDQVARIALKAPLLTKPFRAEALAKAVRGALTRA